MNDMIELIQLMQYCIANIRGGIHKLNSEYELVINKENKSAHIMKKDSNIKITYIMISSLYRESANTVSNISNYSSLYYPNSTKTHISDIKSEIQFINCTLDSYEELRFQYSTIMKHSDIFIFQCLLYSMQCNDMIFVTTDAQLEIYSSVLKLLKEQICQN